MNIRPMIVRGMAYVPYEAFATETEIRAEKRRLTFKSPNSDPGVPPIYLFKDLPEKRYLGVPRAYGLARFSRLAIDDQTSDGAAMLGVSEYRMPSPYHPSVKEPEKQAQFMTDLDASVIRDQNFMAIADTGTGKTVCGSRAAIIRGRRTAILVPLNRLVDRWHKELTELFGVPEHRIGLVQSSTCVYEDCDFVLCMMKSMGMRRYHPDFYDSIGTLVGDEAHLLTSPENSAIISQFPARVRFGLTATPERPGGGDRVIYWNFGPQKVMSKASAVQCNVYVKDYDDGGRMAAVPVLQPKEGQPRPPQHGFRIKKLTEDPVRNQILAGYVFRLWKAGRIVLAIGEHVGHVQEIMRLCEQMGMPRSVMGQCTGERILPNGSRKKVTQIEFNRAKETAEVVFATYGTFKLGIDEPRLDALVPLTPQGKDKQVRGRVRRPYPNKKFAIYVCLRDVGDWMSQNYFDVKQREWARDPQVTVLYNHPDM